MDWFQIRKGVRQGCILSPCLFNLYAEYILRNAGLDEAQAGIKIARRNINNLGYADNTILMAESEEELKSLLMKVKGGEWKSWLKTQHSKNEDHGIWSHHFMANRRGYNGNNERFYFLIAKFFASGGQSIGASASASVFPMNIQDWLPLRLTGLISLQSKGLSRVFSNITVGEHQFFSAQLSL